MDELSAAGYPYLNKIEGDAQQQLKIASLNSGIDLGSDTQLYAFGSYGDKNAASFENYRTPGTVSYTNPATGTVTYQFPYGFSPLEAIEEIDYQVNGGIKGSDPAGIGTSPAVTAVTPWMYRPSTQPI